MMIDERDLLRRVKNDDEEAFRQIFEFYVKKVYQFVYGYLKDKFEAEDVTQNIFQKIWEKRLMIDLNQSFSGFLFTIAYRSVIDHIRKEASKKQWDRIRDIDAEESSSHLTADSLLNNHQFESLYQKALNALTPKRKEIFVLSRHEGLSNKEIADKLDISVKTVENHMTAALFTLREFFNNSELVLIICAVALFL